MVVSVFSKEYGRLWKNYMVCESATPTCHDRSSIQEAFAMMHLAEVYSHGLMAPSGDVGRSGGDGAGPSR